MGILDDAIREHLDLKRRQGAADEELQRLEDEAFGPPSRPGDPDFPQAEEQGIEPATGETAVVEVAPEEGLAIEGALDPDDGPEAEALAEPQAAEPEPAVVEDEPEGGLFDQSANDLDLELDLEEGIDEGIEDAGTVTLEEPEQALAAEDAPIESQPTVEHHFEDAIDEAEVVEEQPEVARAMEADTEGEASYEDEAEEGEDEDVLEETPEFLRDAPEDDELWFEQGEPKDFDF